MSFWLVISVKTNLGVHFSSQFNYNCSPTPGSPRPGPALIVLFVLSRSPGCRTAPLRSALRAPALGFGGEGEDLFSGDEVGADGKDKRGRRQSVGMGFVLFIRLFVCRFIYFYLKSHHRGSGRGHGAVP